MARPNAAISEGALNFSQQETATLPPGLRKTLFASADNIWGKTAEEQPTINMARFDLNGDGKAEYFFEASGGSGGPSFQVIQQQGNRFVIIADFQGDCSFGPERHEGYLNITAYARRGANNYEHQTLHFADGKYQTHSVYETMDGKRKR